MSINRIEPTGRLVSFAEDEIIVSKTDLRGIITYANDVFIRISGYSAGELNGANHNILRHPLMPACVFKLLWDTIQKGNEIFAYVLNLTANGHEYWVFAHVTPSFDLSGNCTGYHSNRRVPCQDALGKVKDLYAELLREEEKHSQKARGIAASTELLLETLATSGMDYDQYVFSLSNESISTTDENASKIAHCVDEQVAATSEISQNVSDVSQNSARVAERIGTHV